MIHNILLTGLGIILLLYGLRTALELREMLAGGELRKTWDRLTALIALFVVGYTGFLVYLVEGIQILNPELITSVVFFSGAIFVALVAHLNKEAFSV